MKKLFMILLLTTSSAFAACESYEAQIIAEVVESRTDSLTFCKAVISAESITLYNEHALCPLNMEEVLENGIDFPLMWGHDCDVPRTISGVLISNGRSIRLD